MSHRPKEYLAVLVACRKETFGDEGARFLLNAGFEPVFTAVEGLEWYDSMLYGEAFMGFEDAVAGTLSKYVRGNVTVYVTDNFTLASDVIQTYPLHAAFLEQRIPGAPHRNGGTDLALNILENNQNTKIFCVGESNLDMIKDVMGRSAPGNSRRMTLQKGLITESLLPIMETMLGTVEDTASLRAKTAQLAL